MQLKRLKNELNGLYHTLPLLGFMRYIWYVFLTIPEILRCGRLSPADFKMEGNCEFNIWNRSVKLNCSEIDKKLSFDKSSSFNLARELFGRNVYLRAFEQFSAIEETIVDVGGNRGFSSILMAKALSPGRLLYIEPDERYEATLKDIFAKNEIELDLVIEHSFIGCGTTDVDMPVKELVDILSRYKIDRIALLKMDIEGAEVEALNYQATWLKGVERIAMESHPEWGDMSVVCSSLESHGFIVISTDPLMSPAEPDKSSYIYAAKDRNSFSKVLW